MSMTLDKMAFYDDKQIRIRKMYHMGLISKPQMDVAINNLFAQIKDEIKKG